MVIVFLLVLVEWKIMAIG